jgi:hypothetical protein
MRNQLDLSAKGCDENGREFPLAWVRPHDPHRSGAAGCDNAVALRTADWLCFAATPTFAIMALLSSVLGDGQLDALCSAAHHGLPLNGMVPMYLLMSAFHSAPWLKAIARWRRGACGP